MKGKLIAALTALTVLLSGCSSLLDREYTDVAPHNTVPTAEGSPSTLRVESYQELVNGLIYLVAQGCETGSLRFYSNLDTVETDLDAACLEVAHEDPLGAYAVDYIRYEVNTLVAYREADIQITYRRTPEQIASIVSATGTTAIRSELERTLAAFSDQLVLRISYFDRDADFVRALFRQAYYAVPAFALDCPDVAVTLYPDEGPQRIVELSLDYHLERSELERRRELLALASGELAAGLRPSSDPSRMLLDAGHAVLGRGGYDPAGGSTAYHALLEGGGDSLGLALALALVCQEADLDCRVAEGVLLGQPHHWNVVSTEDGWRHLDLTRWEQWDSPFQTDEALSALGYQWDAAALPACGQSSLG